MASVSPAWAVLLWILRLRARDVSLKPGADGMVEVGLIDASDEMEEDQVSIERT